MIVLLILAGVSRCAVPTLCPTDDQILTAVRNRDNATVAAVANQAARDDPDSMTLVHPLAIKGISNVICGDSFSSDRPNDPPTITCRFTVRYAGRNAFTVAKMIRKDGEWAIDDSLAVFRDL